MTTTTTIATPRPHRPRTGEWAPTARTIAVLTVTGILVVGQMYLVLPLFGQMGRSFGAAPGDMTWLATAFGLAYAGGFLLAGPLADRYGSRPVIVTGLLATAVTTAAVAVATDLTTGCVLRALQGLTAATFAPAAFSYVAGHLAPARRTFALTCMTSGFLAAAVLVQVASQVLSGVAGWRAAFLVFAPLLALAALATRITLRQRPAEAPVTGAGAAFAAMPRLLARPRLLGLYAVTATVLGGFVAVYSAISLSGPAGLAGHPAALLILRASALPAMVAVPIAAPLLARLPARARLTLGLGVAALAALAASVLATRTVALGAVLLILVAGVAIAAPALVESIGAQAGAARGAAVALYAFAMFLGASFGPQVVAISRGSGMAGALHIVVGVFGAGAVLAALSARTDRRVR